MTRSTGSCRSAPSRCGRTPRTRSRPGKRFDPRALTALLARDVELDTPLPDGCRAAARARDRRLRQAARRRSGPVAPRKSVERRRRSRLRDRARRAGDRGDGRVLRPRDAGATCTDRGRRLRAAVAALRPLGPRVHGRRRRHHAAVGVVVARTSSHSESVRARGTCSTTKASSTHANASTRRAPRAARSSTRGAAVRDAAGSRVAVHVAAAVTHTIGGIAVDTQRAPPRRRRLRRGRRRRRCRDRRLRERARAGARARARRAR